MRLSPNPLNIYESYSYDIQMVISPEGIGKNTGAQLPPGTGVTIAATGKTANFYIDRVEMKSVPNTSQNNTHTTVTEISVGLDEPMGFTLFDRYLSACAMMGWKNPMKAAIYITISWNGWLPSGAPHPKVHKTTWRCLMVDWKSDIEFTGTKYTLKFIPLDLLGYTSELLTVQRPVKAEIKKKLSATLQEVENELNRTASGAQAADNKPPEPYNKYKLKLGKRLSDLDLDMYVEQQVGTNTTNRGADGKLWFQGFSGQTVEELLVKLVTNAKNIVKTLVPNVRGDNTTESTDVPGTTLANWIRVTPGVTYTKFNSSQNDYEKTVEYVVDLHYRPEVETIPPKTKGPQSRAMAYIKHGLLNKRFDYIFTGKNTEVLNLKIDFNSLFSQIVTTYTNSIQDQTIGTDEETRAQEEQQKKTRKMPTKIKDSSVTTSNITAGGFLLEEIPPVSSMEDLINFKVLPVGNPQYFKSGVGTLTDKDTNKQMDKVAEHGQRAKASNKQAEFTGVINSMLSISMEVRGDPYWLGITDLKDNKTNAEANDSVSMANWPAGSQFFYLKFKMPETYDTSSGLPWRVGRLTFSAIYHVMSVTSVFENGKFTQTISGAYDLTTNGVDLGDG